MSANPEHPGAGFAVPSLLGLAGPNAAIRGFPRSDHRDLENLLALSSLHEQIRSRREHELYKGARLTSEDEWELKQLVHDEVLQLVADRALMVTGADGVAVALVDGSGIVCRASAGSIAPERGARLDPYSGFSGACLRTGEIVRCDDSEKDDRVSAEACRRLNTRSMVAVPLATPCAIVGVLEAFSTEPLGFNDSDVRSLSLLSELILDAMKPEEEDRLAEISQQVVGAPPAVPEVPVAQIEPGRLESIQLPEFTERLPESYSELDSGSRGPEALKQNAKLVFLSDYEHVDDSRPGLKLVILLVTLAIALGAGLWWQVRHNARVKPVHKAVTTPANTQFGILLPGTFPATDEPSASTELAPATIQPEAAEKSSYPEITGIRHWSSEASSTVVIDLQDQVQYEAHRLTSPERIYFDLLDTTLAHGLFGKTIEVNDPVLQRIRVAQPKQGVTRIVLDTKGASNYSVSMEQNPVRLMVEVGKLGSKVGPAAKLNLFGTGRETAVASRKLAPKPRDPAPGIAILSRENKINPLVVRPLGPSIVLDAGHGGWDLGTVGRKGLEEKDLVLDIVQRLGGLLEHRLNAKITYTRSDDSYVALEKRAEIANLSQAKLFVSIHANYSNSVSARGVETYYTNTYSSLKARPAGADEALQNVDWTKVNIREKVQGSHRLAECVQQALFGTVAAKNPGVRDRGVKAAQYVVLTGTSMPAILSEVSFVSSPEDENELQNTAYRQRIAEALYKGIARYQEMPRHATVAALAPQQENFIVSAPAIRTGRPN